MQETRCESPTETSRHSTVRQEICIFSKLLNLISGNLTSNEISQKAKHDLQKILAWFIIDCFVHNIDLIALSRKSFRPQNSDNETVLADEIDYNRDPDWSHPLFIKTLTDISSQAVTTIFIKKDNVKITHLLLMQHPASSTKNNSSILTSPFITTEVIYIYDRFTKRHLDTSHYITIFGIILHMHLLIIFFLQTHPPLLFLEPTNHKNTSPRIGPQDSLVTHYDCGENEQKTQHKYAINQVTQCEPEPQEKETKI